LARRLYGERASGFAVVVQASSLLYVGLSRITTLDMSLCFTLQMTLTALALLVHRPTERDATTAARDPRWLAVLLAIGVALAMLAKGLIGILIPGAVGALYMLIYRDPQLLLRARVHWTLAALLLIASPWFFLVSLRTPQFAHFFFVFEHFQRFLTVKGHDRYHSAWYFLPVLAGGIMPWLSLLPRTLLEAARAARREPATGLLLLWVVFVYAFFSASQSKLVPYILPLIPALSALMGATLSRLSPRRLAAHLIGLAVLAALVALAVLGVVALAHAGAPRPRAWMALASGASIALLVAALLVQALGAAVGAQFAHRGRALRGAAAAGLGALLFAQCAVLGSSRLPRERENTQLAVQLQPLIGRYRHFYCVNLYLQTIPFYLRRTCTLVAYRGELDFGLSLEPSLGITRLADFLPVWQADGSALALLRTADYPRLVALGAPMRVIYTSPSYMAVVRQ
jgi:4-amino-4-deoxy-L-arabinose transferase-like glycosyltransferase